jgi:hypothetical protein
MNQITSQAKASILFLNYFFLLLVCLGVLTWSFKTAVLDKSKDLTAGSDKSGKEAGDVSENVEEADTIKGVAPARCFKSNHDPFDLHSVHSNDPVVPQIEKSKSEAGQHQQSNIYYIL